MTIQEILATVRRVEIRTNLSRQRHDGGRVSQPVSKGAGWTSRSCGNTSPATTCGTSIGTSPTGWAGSFIKRFREERELGVILAVDISASSKFGSAYTAANGNRRWRSPRRWPVPPRTAATRSGCCCSRDEVEFAPAAAQGPPAHPARDQGNAVLRGRANAARTSSPRADVFESRHQTALDRFFVQRFSAQLRRGRAQLEGGAGPRAVEIGMTNARHADSICVHLHDPRESELPRAGLLTIEDVPRRANCWNWIPTRHSVRQKFARNNSQRLSDLDRAMRAGGRRYAAIHHGPAVCPDVAGIFRDTARAGVRG